MIKISEDHQMVRDSVAELVNAEILPKAYEIDQNHRYPQELIDLLSEQGFMGVNASSELGGSEMDYLSYALIIEEISRGCASTGVIVSVNNSLALSPLIHFASEEQKKKWIPALARGEKLGCFSLSEPQAGSDAGAIQCTAKKEGDFYVINGVKNWVTNGKESDVVILFASIDTDLKHKGVCAFYVDKETPGLKVGKLEEKLGILGSSTTELVFENCKIPAENLIANEGDGFKIAMHTLDGGRLGIAAQAVGIARAAFDRALKYAKERESFGKVIGKHQAIQFKLADMAMKIEASQALLYNASKLKDAGLPYSKESAMAKTFASETATWVSLEAIQIHGGYGYTKEFEVERHLRDAKITEIYEGTSEVQRIVTAAHLLKD
jgi:butyryl-CoA dehydrogenase